MYIDHLRICIEIFGSYCVSVTLGTMRICCMIIFFLILNNEVGIVRLQIYYGMLPGDNCMHFKH